MNEFFSLESEIFMNHEELNNIYDLHVEDNSPLNINDENIINTGNNLFKDAELEQFDVK